jgi:hypothetical protein
MALDTAVVQDSGANRFPQAEHRSLQDTLDARAVAGVPGWVPEVKHGQVVEEKARLDGGVLANA